MHPLTTSSPSNLVLAHLSPLHNDKMSGNFKSSTAITFKLYISQGSAQVYSQTMSLSLGGHVNKCFKFFWGYIVAYLQQLPVFDFVADTQIMERL